MWKNGAKKFHGVEKWTAWKPSLQKAETADDAKVQTVAGGGDPGVLWFSVAGGGDPGVLWFSVAGGGDPGTGLNEPSYKNSQQPKQPTTRLATPPRNARQAARWRGKPHGRRGSRPSKRRKQPQGCWPPDFGSGFLEGRVTPRPGCWLLAVDSSAAGPRIFSGHGRRGSRPSRRRKQPPGCWPPDFFRSWTAWKPSLQKAKTAQTADNPACHATAQCAASRADGVEAVPPEDRNSRRCKGSDCSRGR